MEFRLEKWSTLRSAGEVAFVRLDRTGEAMFKDERKLTCEEFQSQISELITSGTNIGSHPHVMACANCRQLLQEIETVAENARKFRFGTNQSDTDDWSETT